RGAPRPSAGARSPRAGRSGSACRGAGRTPRAPTRPAGRTGRRSSLRAGTVGGSRGLPHREYGRCGRGCGVARRYISADGRGNATAFGRPGRGRGGGCRGTMVRPRVRGVNGSPSLGSALLDAAWITARIAASVGVLTWLVGVGAGFAALARR